MPEPIYRVGPDQPRNLYRGDVYIGVCFDELDAAQVVAALNARVPQIPVDARPKCPDHGQPMVADLTDLDTGEQLWHCACTYGRAEAGVAAVHHWPGVGPFIASCGVATPEFSTYWASVTCADCLREQSDVSLKPGPEAIRQARLRCIDARNRLAAVLREACPGPGQHVYVQHRDGRVPWCDACGYSEDGFPWRPTDGPEA